jgi:hypothetical protein
MFGDETMAIPPHQPFRRQDCLRMSYAFPFVRRKETPLASEDHFIGESDALLLARRRWQEIDANLPTSHEGKLFAWLARTLLEV